MAMPVAVFVSNLFPAPAGADRREFRFVRLDTGKLHRAYARDEARTATDFAVGLAHALTRAVPLGTGHLNQLRRSGTLRMRIHHVADQPVKKLRVRLRDPPQRMTQFLPGSGKRRKFCQAAETLNFLVVDGIS